MRDREAAEEYVYFRESREGERVKKKYLWKYLLFVQMTQETNGLYCFSCWKGFKLYRQYKKVR